VTLVARGAEMPGGARLLVFDDISEIVSAQRAQAWGEVARRLAHEIKNPLTPIQLSAERHGDEAGRQAAAHPTRRCWPSRCTPSSTRSIDEAAGQRIPRLRPPAGRRTEAGRPERAGGRRAALYAREATTRGGPAHVPVRMELDPPRPPSWATRSSCGR
jgi:hypothetical protein